MNDNLIRKKSFIDEIPCSICYIDDGSNKSLLILSHGFSGKKEDWSDRMEQLAKIGYYTVALDNRFHGERKGISFKGKIFTTDGQLNLIVLRQVMDETANDISVLIDHFVNYNNIDASKIGIIGISMGGFITYASFVKDKRISFAIPIISSPFWDDVPEDTHVLNTETAIKEFKDYAVKNSPANQYEKFYPGELFALIGTNDKHFKPKRVVDFFEKLKRYYKTKSKNIRINQYNVGHEVNNKMWDDVIKWLKERVHNNK